MHANEAASWDNSHERFEIERINFQKAHSLHGACVNMAEAYFSSLRRAEVGIHGPAGPFLLQYARGAPW